MLQIYGVDCAASQPERMRAIIRSGWGRTGATVAKGREGSQLSRPYGAGVGSDWGFPQLSAAGSTAHNQKTTYTVPILNLYLAACFPGKTSARTRPGGYSHPGRRAWSQKGGYFICC